MRALLLIGVFFYSLFVNSQNEQKALQYFNNGEFEKALITYNKLYEVNNGNTNYLLKIIIILLFLFA